MDRLDARGDGDGWTECALGHRHWGVHGAAGLLLHRTLGESDQVLLQHRATWSHHGGTWGLLGGARHRAEAPVTAALREAGEEGGVGADDVHLSGQFADAHGAWTYTTVLADAGPGVEARPTGGETIAVAWVPVYDVTALPLHPGFARSWPMLRRSLRPLTVVVDAANVVGSRPDGWWRDRAGAARKLIASCGALAGDGLAADDVPAFPARPPWSHWWPRWAVVLEGAARAAAADNPTATAAPDRAPAVAAVAAEASGDDAVVATVADTLGPTIVVTADRGLRARCETAGATVVGPRWLTTLVDRHRTGTSEEDLR